MDINMIFQSKDKEKRIADYVAGFNSRDEETIRQYIDNAHAAAWMNGHVPYFECSDRTVEETYYFRWWVYRKHIKKTPEGFIITEFLPAVYWAGAYNSINCAAGHHLGEGRWLRDGSLYMEDYLRFWMQGSGNVRSYSTWIADALYQYCLVRGDFGLAVELLPELVSNYEAWEKSHLHESGLFWSVDDRDAMEYSISGNGLRPILNSYLYADAKAIANIAGMTGDRECEERFIRKAEKLKELVQSRLWDEEDGFFKVYPLQDRSGQVTEWDFSKVDRERNVCEEIGFIPWCFELPDAGYEKAWRYLRAEDGFEAPYGPVTAARSHKNFRRKHPEHECLWNGPSWPFATTQTLTALANVLKDYRQDYVTQEDFFTLFSRYTRSHYRTLGDGRKVNWLDENLEPFTGRWLSRDILESWGWREDKGGYERGKDYNHSGYANILISKIFGMEPQQDGTLRIRPMMPKDWAFCGLDGLQCQGHVYTVCWDRTGEKYHLGKGLHVWRDGVAVTAFDNCRVTFPHSF